MPKLVEGSDVSAHLSAGLAAAWGLAGARIPVAGGGGDNAASAVGIGAVNAGEGFLSLGTSGVIFAVTDRFVAAPERTLHAFCHALPGRWHGMGVILSAAASLSWIAGLVGQAGQVDALISRAQAWAETSEHRANAPIFLPYLSGERTPHNDPQASGLFAGLRADHGAAALTYAVLEGVAFALADSQDVMRDAGASLRHCMLVGGGARSRFWAALLADVLNLELHVSEGAEAGAALGAARLGMLAAGAGTEAQVCARPPIRETLRPSAEAHAAFAPRLARFRVLYRAEKATRN
jgi:xylulokinase